jgi:hypothetical protein
MIYSLNMSEVVIEFLAVIDVKEVSINIYLLVYCVFS